MMVLGLFVVTMVVVVSLVVVAAVLGGRARPSPVVGPPAPGPDQLARWQEAGLITGEQAESIVAHEHAPPPYALAGAAPERPRQGT
jgi:hypothetical protein